MITFQRKTEGTKPINSFLSFFLSERRNPAKKALVWRHARRFHLSSPAAGLLFVPKTPLELMYSGCLVLHQLSPFQQYLRV